MRVFLPANREYLAPQIRSMNNRFHSEAKLPWSYDYPLANYIATNKSCANREMPMFSRLYPSFGYFRKIFPPRGLKYSLFNADHCKMCRCTGSHVPYTQSPCSQKGCSLQNSECESGRVKIMLLENNITVRKVPSVYLV